MKIEHLRLFLSICELQSISKAAENTYMSQQSLSIILKHMEDELGMNLLCRTNKGIVMTDEGESFRQYCLRIVALYDQFISEHRPRFLQNKIINLYTTPLISQFFPDIFEQRFLGEYILSIYECSNVDLWHYVQQKKYGVLIFTIPESELFNIKDIVLQKISIDDKSIYFCAKEEADSDLSKTLKEKTLVMMATYMNTDPIIFEERRIIRVNNIDVCKKLIREKKYIGLTSPTMYAKFFNTDDYMILEEKPVERIAYCLVCNLGSTAESKLMEEALVQFVKDAFNRAQ